MCEVPVKKLRWNWFLPVAQLIFAFAALVYGPHQYKVRELEVGVSGDNNMLEYSAQNFPAPVERISNGINFPALTLAYPLRNYNVNELFFYANNYTFVRIYFKDIGFFLAILVFWYWVGRKLEQSQRHGTGTTRPRWMRVAGVSCGLVFGILTGTYAVQMLVRDWHWRPERQIGSCGIVWSLALVVYFVWRVRQELRNGLQKAPSETASNATP
jgi:hypothetical protein